jgi:hypothetical protein
MRDVRRDVPDPLTIEFITIAVDAPCRHLHAPGAPILVGEAPNFSQDGLVKGAYQERTP